MALGHLTPRSWDRTDADLLEIADERATAGHLSMRSCEGTSFAPGGLGPDGAERAGRQGSRQSLDPKVGQIDIHDAPQVLGPTMPSSEWSLSNFRQLMEATPHIGSAHAIGDRRPSAP